MRVKTDIKESFAIRLNAESLMSKWGFSDGDVILDWWMDVNDEEPPFNYHDVLHALIVEYLMPAIKEAGHDVTIFTIDTIHNPVRAESINGAFVAIHRGDEQHFDPEVVVGITSKQIQDMIDELN